MATDYRRESPVDTTFGTDAQIEYARRIAEHLRKQSSKMSPGMAVLPGSWMYGAADDVSKALLGNRYEGIAGQQDKALTERQFDPDYQPNRDPTTLGGQLGQSLGDIGRSLFGGMKNFGKGEKSARLTTPGKEPDEITTGSIDPDLKPPGPGDPYFGDPTTAPKLEMDQPTPGPTKIPGGVDRSSFNSEIEKNPALIRRMASMVKGETGLGPDVDLTKQRIQLASAIDRSMIREHGLEQGLRTVGYHPKSGYYAKDTYSKGGYNGERLSKKELDWFKKNVYEPVMAGDDPGTKFLGSPVTGNASEGNSNFASRRLANGQYAKGKWYDGNRGEMYVTEKSDADRLKANPDLLPRYPGQEPSNPQPQAKLPGQIGGGALGEDTAAVAAAQDAAEKGQQVAQQAPFTSTPVGGGAPGTPVQNNNPPGYTGAMPPAQPLESTDQLRARMLRAPVADQPKILEDYMKRASTQWHGVPGGNLGVTAKPGGAAPQGTFIPGADVPLTVGDMHIMMRNVQDPQTGKVTQKFILPGGPEGGFGSLNEAMEWSRQQKAQTQDLTTRTQETAKHYSEMQNHVSNTQLDTADRQTKLKLAENLVNDPHFISGTAAQRRVAINKFFDTVGVNPPGEGADVTQSFVKFLNENILQDIKGLGGLGLGQIRAKEMEVIQKMNPDIDMSPSSIRMLVNAMQRVNDRAHTFNGKAMDYMDKNNGKLDRGFDKEMREHYQNKPIYSDRELRDYRQLFSGKKEGKVESYRINKEGKLEKVE